MKDPQRQRILVTGSPTRLFPEQMSACKTPEHSFAPAAGRGEGGLYCGYSPERINPGDKAHRLPSISKVTSGSTPEIAEAVDQLYRSMASIINPPTPVRPPVG